MKKTLLFSLVALFVSLFAKAQTDYKSTYTSNVVMTANTNSQSGTVNGYDAVKCGTSSKVGTVSITLPAGTTKLHLHAGCWGTKTVDVEVSGAAATPSSLSLLGAGFSGNSPFTTTASDDDTYRTLEFATALTEETVITLTPVSAIRFIVWGVNAETSETGGEEPGTDPTPEPEPDPDPVVDVVEPVISPNTYYHANTVDVTIAAEEGLTVYYTIDGTDPTTESEVYSSPITISATDATVKVTVKAIAVDAEGNVSDIVSATYTVNVVKPMEVPEGCVGFDFVMNPWGYTLGSGSGETAEAGNILEPIIQDGVTITFDQGEAGTPARMWSYDGGGQLRVYNKSSFTISAPADKQITSVDLNIAKGTLTADGSADGKKWEGAAESVTFTCTSNAQIKTILVALSDKSGEGEGGDTPVVVEAPVITPATGTYSEAQTVTITAAEGNSIFYTLDGTEPSDASTVYEGPFTVSETTTIKAIATNDDDVASPVATSVITILPTYKSIADMLAVISTEKVDVVYEFENLLVQGVNGANVYVHDGANAFLIYCYDSNLKKGDKISGRVTGQIYLYNNLPEISLTGDKWAGVTVASEGNEVVPAVKTIPELTKDIVNEFIRLEGVSFSLASGSNYTFTDGTNSINIYEKNLLKDVTFSTEEKYNINAFVSIYKETIQLSITSADDVELITVLKDAEAAWDVEEVEIKVGETLNNKFTTVSDGAVTYTSSHPAVVAVAEDGTLTVAGPGRAVITAEVAETATYLADKAEFVVVVRSDADGSLENPYLVSDAMAIYVSDATIAGMWVKGYMIGYVEGSSPSGITLAMPTEAQTEVIIANTADETDVNNCFVVQLPKGQIRDDVELFAHPELYGKEIMFKGDILKYFGIAGMKNTTDYSLDGGVTIPTGINGVEVEDANAPKVIYTIAGQRVNTITKGGIYIINGKKVLVK